MLVTVRREIKHARRLSERADASGSTVFHPCLNADAASNHNPCCRPSVVVPQRGFANGSC